MPEFDFSNVGRLSQGMAFLDSCGWEQAVIYPIPGDASFRRYARIEGSDQDAILMDAPPEHEDVRPFVQIANHLRSLGFSAPEIFFEDPEQGFLLLEDLGTNTFTQTLLANPDTTTERDLYTLAIDTLVHLHQLDPATAAPDWVPPYNDEKLLAETALFTDWFLPAVGLDDFPEGARADFDNAWLEVFPAVHQGPRTLVLRDFHVDNLVRIEDRDGIRACGLLDFQDAVAGNGAYDVASLLQDARRDIAAELKKEMLARYLDAMGFSSEQADRFNAAVAILAAQRHAKVIGIFTRLSVRDGKHHYLDHIERVWKLLERALMDPALAPVNAWFDAHVPADARVAPAKKDPA